MIEESIQVDALFPPKLLKLVSTPSRYKIAYGGRGGGKTIAFSVALCILGWEKPLRILCAREYQISIADSCHKNIVDAIAMLNLGDFYTIGQQTITGRNGTEIRFVGLKRNISAIRSYAGIDICWVEEASNVSKASWEVLIPTIRQPNSEIWLSFNPELETDYTYQSFVVKQRPDSQIVRINYLDNPWFGSPMLEEMEYLKSIDDNAYQNVWLGHPKTFLEGAVYSKELQAAAKENRLTKVDYDRSTAVHTFWDLGYRDFTSIWFAQIVDRQFRIIDFYENNGQLIQFYLQELQTKGYLYGTHYLPHDSANRGGIASDRSVEGVMRETCNAGVRVLPRWSVEDGIQAARTIFPQCYFDQEKCTDGLTALRKYRYDEMNVNATKPIHDSSSHAADAFRYLAMALRDPKHKVDPDKIKPVFQRFTASSGSWLGR